MRIEHAGSTIDLAALDVKKHRRDGSARVYSDNRSLIVRLGDKRRLQEEYANHLYFLRRHFPAPDLLSDVIPVDDTTVYYLESFLGTHSLGDLARIQPAGAGLGNNVFQHVQDFMVRLTDFQTARLTDSGSSPLSPPAAFDTIRERCAFPDLMSAFLARCERAFQGIPYAMCHGNFNVFNMFPPGLIDFQKARPVLFGFDQVNCLINPYLFPPGGTERDRCYRFSRDQLADLHRQCESSARANGVPELRQYQDDLTIWILISFMLYNEVFPRFAAWRYRLLERLLLRRSENKEVFWPLVHEELDE